MHAGKKKIIDHVSGMIHKLLHPVLLILFTAGKPHKIILVNEMPPVDGNAIFAVNHSNKYDVPYTCKVVKRHCYILAGKQPLDFIDKLAFVLNGTVWVDRKNREDKKKATASVIQLLQRGNNLIIYPEGTWNLSPSKPLLPLYWGVIDIARKSGRPIAPLVLEYTKDKCYAMFGSLMHISADDNKGEKIEQLSDHMATLKWEIWDRFSDTGYNSAEEWEKEVRKRIADYPKLNCEYEREIVRGPCGFEDIIDMRRIIPSKANAFLFNKKNHN